MTKDERRGRGSLLMAGAIAATGCAILADYLILSTPASDDDPGAARARQAQRRDGGWTPARVAAASRPAEEGDHAVVILDDEDVLVEEVDETELSSSRVQVAMQGSGPFAYPVAAGEALVKLAAGVSPEEAARIARSAGSAVLQSGALSGLYRMKVPEGTTLDAFMKDLERHPEVEGASPNALAVATWRGTGAHRSKQWNFHHLGMDDLDGLEPAGLAGIVVAVLDTGVAFESRDERGTGGKLYAKHPEFDGVTFVSPWDAVHGDAHPNDANRHGSHIAGIIAAQAKVTGLAQPVQIMPVQVLDQNKIGTELDIIEGIHHAVDHGADIINMSLSFGLGYFPSAGLQAAISHAVDNDVVMVASAGNKGVWGVSYPGAFPDVISVGASRMRGPISGVSAGDGLAAYGSWGYALDVLAPGGLVDSDFDLDGWPDGILSAGFDTGRPDKPNYWFLAGTSQATAHVSAAAAWLLAEGASPDQVLPILADTSSYPDSSVYDPTTGSGAIHIKNARAKARSNPNVNLSQYYVNITPWFEDSGSGWRYGAARVQVMKANGQPASNVEVGGTWLGSYVSYQARGRTDGSGMVVIKTPGLSCPSGCALGFQVDRVYNPDAKVEANPLSYYSLSPGSAEVLYRLSTDANLANAAVLYKIPQASSDLSSYVGSRTQKESYVIRSAAGGLRSGPIAIVLDSTFAADVTAATGAGVSDVTWSFGTPLGYGTSGTVSSVTGKRVDRTSARLGSATRYLILPLDTAMGRLNLTKWYPVINAVGASFEQTNRAFGNQISSASLGDAFAASSLGDAFAASSLGDAFAASSLGDAFASSSLGDAFAASSMGNSYEEGIVVATSAQDAAMINGQDFEGSPPLDLEAISTEDDECVLEGLVTSEEELSSEAPTMD